MMSKVMLISSKDNNFYNFRKELIIKLIDMEYEVVLVCPYGKKIDFFTEKGCNFINIEMDRRGKSICKDFKLLINYFRVIKSEKPDVVLTYTSKPSIYAGILCKHMKIPYIVNNAGLMETTGFFDLFMKVLYKTAWSKAFCMMYQNKYERDCINDILKNKVYHRDLPGSGVNLDEFQFADYPDEHNEIIINYVARIVKIKGIEEFLECAKVIKNEFPYVKFNIYGDYDDNSYKKTIEELEYKKIVEYKGIKLDMKPYISLSHAVIHPSYYEGMTNVVLEHSAMGRVCIGSNINGVKEGIEQRKTGFLFEVKNTDSLINAVRDFLKLTHHEKKEMGLQARKKMEREFDRNMVSNIYLQEILKCVKY